MSCAHKVYSRSTFSHCFLQVIPPNIKMYTPIHMHEHKTLGHSAVTFSCVRRKTGCLMCICRRFQSMGNEHGLSLVEQSKPLGRLFVLYLTGENSNTLLSIDEQMLRSKNKPIINCCQRLERLIIEIIFPIYTDSTLSMIKCICFLFIDMQLGVSFW